jgi:hypothetical protein
MYNNIYIYIIIFFLRFIFNYNNINYFFDLIHFLIISLFLSCLFILILYLMDIPLYKKKLF